MVATNSLVLSSRIFETEITNTGAGTFSSVQGKRGAPGNPAPTFPVETLRHWYVTPFGGMSVELEPFQVGINREALETNTSLDPSTDRVRVTVLGRVRRPLVLDRFFEVVPLDERHPEALRRSPMGEAVFPEGDDVFRARDEVLRQGGRGDSRPPTGGPRARGRPYDPGRREHDDLEAPRQARPVR